MTAFNGGQDFLQQGIDAKLDLEVLRPEPLETLTSVYFKSIFAQNVVGTVLQTVYYEYIQDPSDFHGQLLFLIINYEPNEFLQVMDNPRESDYLLDLLAQLSRRAFYTLKPLHPLTRWLRDTYWAVMNKYIKAYKKRNEK